MIISKTKVNKLIVSRGLKVSFIHGQTTCSRKTFYNYLHGATEAPDSFINELAIALGVKISEITS